MKVVKVRSPFIIEVGGYGFGHTKSQVIISIWNEGTPEPMPGDNARYILSKSNPSETQKTTYYNVSNYVREFIENIKPTKIVSSPSYEDNNEWVYFRVAKYWYNKFTFEYVLISTNLYVGVNGFTTYTQGVNSIIDSATTGFLSNDLISKNILKSSSSLKNYGNWMGEFTGSNSVNIVYTNLSNTYTITQTVSGLSGIYNLKIPLTLHPTNTNFQDGCKLTVNFYNGATLLNSDVVFVNSIEECKYTPVECTFINRYGGWEFLTFFKAQSNTVTSKGTDYKLTQLAINYNTLIGQYKTFNINGKQTVKLNTGWVDENYSELITDLMLSETVLLDGKPVTVKTQSSDLKTYLKTKNINYEVDFEYAYNLINDVV